MSSFTYDDLMKTTEMLEAFEGYPYQAVAMSEATKQMLIKSWGTAKTEWAHPAPLNGLFGIDIYIDDSMPMGELRIGSREDIIASLEDNE
jgi:hypothetical protein